MSLSSDNSAPHHLHSILARVRESSSVNYASGWAQALDAEWGSLEFAKRHSEVVNLLLDTVVQLNALPERARERSLRYVPSWWIAVVQPQANWTDNGRDSSSIITPDMLDHLEAAADIIAGSLVGSTAAPRSTDLQGISDQCQEWIDLLQSMDDVEISGSVRDELLSQIEHLIWLIDNVHIFGAARVSTEASRVIGSLAQASATMGNSNPDTASRWGKAWIAFIAVCVAFNVGAPIVQESIQSGTAVVKEIASVVDDVRGAE
ncbi:hypothetical protein ACFWP5_08600 [Streptomyces sp. NPDC058469]|uniref:hypothetical protein n=1 Tax=Streptomyces sp. NPDC058469 TaxID=3346514 RepID=UPI00364EA2B9